MKPYARLAVHVASALLALLVLTTLATLDCHRWRGECNAMMLALGGIIVASLVGVVLASPDDLEG